LVRGAFVQLEMSEWVYAVVTTVVMVFGLSLWARHAFSKYIVMRTG